MKLNLGVAVCLAIALTAGSAGAQSTCNSVLELGFKNIEKKYGQRASLVSKYMSYCGKDYASWSEQQSISASVDVVGSWGASGGYTKAAADQKLKEWCNVNKSLETASGVDITESYQVSKEAVTAWQACQTLYSSGLKIEAMPTDDTVNLRVRYDGEVKEGLVWYGVDAVNFTCNTQFPRDSSMLAGRRRVTTEAIDVYCTRATAKTVDNRPTPQLRREKASITVRTAAKTPYTLSFIDEWSPNVPVAESRRLDQELAALKKELAAVKTELTESVKQQAAAFDGKYNSVVGRVDGIAGFRDKVQSGSLDVGASGGNQARVRVNFPRQMPGVPMVTATMKSNPNDMIVVDITSVDGAGFDAWLWRINGGGWAATQTIQWIAVVP